jgi:hypothetical protein
MTAAGGAEPGRGDDQPSPEDPNRFPPEGEAAPLDEAPDGRTPSDPNDPDPDTDPDRDRSTG